MEDLLLDDTRQVITEVFDVPHVFPTEFVKGEVKRGFWARMRAAIASCLGRGRRTVAAAGDEQGGELAHGQEDGV